MNKARFRTQKNGQKIRIELSVKEFESLVEDLEELDAIRAYDAAINSGERPNGLQKTSPVFHE